MNDSINSIENTKKVQRGQNKTTVIQIPVEAWQWVHDNNLNFSAIARRAIYDLMEVNRKHGVSSFEELERKMLQLTSQLLALQKKVDQKERLIEYYQQRYGEVKSGISS